MRIAVAGGTGVVGTYAVQAIIEAGHEAVVLSRSHGVDLRTDTGVARALEGVETIIDASNAATTSGKKAAAFFTAVTTRLQKIGSAQGVSRLVTVSIVGIDDVTGLGYYRAKQAQEEAAKVGPLSVTIVRATQFHEFPAQLLSRARLGALAGVPSMRVQPVAARSVGRCLMEAAVHPPPEQLTQVAGPQIEEVVSMARQIARRRGRRMWIVPLAIPGAAGRAIRRGHLQATPTTALVGPSFADWLASDDALFPEF